MGETEQQILDRVQQEEVVARNRAEERRRRRGGLSYLTWQVIAALCLLEFVIVAIASVALAPRDGRLDGALLVACITALGAIAGTLGVLLPLCWIGAFVRGLMARQAQ